MIVQSRACIPLAAYPAIHGLKRPTYTFIGTRYTNGCISKTRRLHRIQAASVEINDHIDQNENINALADVDQPLPEHWRDHLQNLRPGERRALTKYFPLLDKINALEPYMQSLSDEQLSIITNTLRNRILNNNQPLLSLIPEAFALVREASSRVLGLRHYDVQMLGGIILANGQVSEMRTGEGKTLVAALPAYLYALTGRGVHVVTVNDYLAQRDREWIGKVLESLGLSVGVVTSGSELMQRTHAFACDVTYVTAYEVAFTFLKDNLASTAHAVALRRPLHYAIVDEVDSLLIDEARNPFIINAPFYDMASAPAWRCAAAVAKQLQGPPLGAIEMPSDDSMFDFTVNMRMKLATLTSRGMKNAVKLLASPQFQQLYLAVRHSSNSNKNKNGSSVEKMGTMTQPTDIETLDEQQEKQQQQQDDDDVELYTVLVMPQNGTSTNTSTEINVTIQPVSSREPQGITTHIKQHMETATDYSLKDIKKRFDTTINITVPDMASIESVLGNKLDLHIIPFDRLTDTHLARAAPSVLWTGGDVAWGRFLSQTLRAVHLYQKDIDYIVRDGQVVIIDAATGRERERSRWQHGLHQAIEAKEQNEGNQNVDIKSEDFDMGRVTYQCLFNEYETLSGMSGTAATEAESFGESYNLEVVRVPPHRPSKRRDSEAEMYVGKGGWQERLIDIVRCAAAQKRPVLLCTASVEESEDVLALLWSIPFQGDLLSSERDRMGEALQSMGMYCQSQYMEDQVSLFDNTTTSNGSSNGSNGNNNGMSSSSNQEEQEQVAWVIEQYTSFVIPVLQNLAETGKLCPINVDAVSKCYLFLMKIPPRLLPGSCEVICSILAAVFRRAALGKNVPINLLNARPEKAKKEAEIIAQAGLPGTITVATSMAGRGTDILLGGNPKGLTSIALQHFLLPLLTPNAEDLRDYSMQQPFAGLPEHYIFSSLPDMALHLPNTLVDAFKNARRAAMEVASMNGHATARDGMVLLSRLIEEVETDRSHYLLSLKRQKSSNNNNGDTGDKYDDVVSSLDTALEWICTTNATTPPPLSLTNDKYQQKEQEEQKEDDPMSVLKQYTLLQWLWFDSKCEEYARVVRSAGGLVVIITSLPVTRRTELQLRGRAGRQGDPGETFLLSSREDPALTASLNPAQLQGVWQFIAEDGGESMLLPRLVTAPILKKVQQSIQMMEYSSSESTRRYDEVIDPYRRHVHRLRRTLAGGGDRVRAILLHRYMRTLSEEFVELYCSSSCSYFDSSIFSKSFWKKMRGGIFNTKNHVDSKERFMLGLKELLHEIEHIVNGDDVSNNTTPISINLDVDTTAPLLYSALLGGDETPLPGITFDTSPFETLNSKALGGQENNENEENNQEGASNKKRKGLILSLSRSNALHTARRETLSTLHQRKHLGKMKKRLIVWVGDVLAHVYEIKRAAVLSHWISSTHKPLNPNTRDTSSSLRALQSPYILHATSQIRLYERDIFMNCIDDLWSDFLQDINILQRAAQSRSFSLFDPVDEFRLESSSAFARLLTQYRRRVAVSMMGSIENAIGMTRPLLSSSSSLYFDGNDENKNNSEFMDDDEVMVLNENESQALLLLRDNNSNDTTTSNDTSNDTHTNEWSVDDDVVENEIIDGENKISIITNNTNNDDDDNMDRILKQIAVRLAMASVEELDDAIQNTNLKWQQRNLDNNNNDDDIM